MLDWLRNKFRRPTIFYSPEQQYTVEKHIRKCFGDLEETMWVEPDAGMPTEIVQLNRIPDPGDHMVAPEPDIPDMQLDFHLFGPKPGHMYYTMCTVGAGAYRMNVPDNRGAFAHAEFVMHFPPEWKIEDDDKWHWARDIMRAIICEMQKQKLCYFAGFTMDFGRKIDPEAEFSALMLFRARGLRKDSDVCQLPDGSQVIFYQLYPVYKEELDYAKSRGKKELVERLSAVGGRIYNPRRFNVGLHCSERPLTMLYAGGEHALKRAEMELNADERSAYLYPAVFLRWMIEHKLTGAEFEAWQGKAAEAIRAGSYDGDLREFVRDELGGVLTTGCFSEEGEVFAKWYFAEGNRAPNRCRMWDIDEYALEYFGAEQYCTEMKTEGYLFLPWNEEIYQALARKISAAHEKWKNLR